MIFVDILVVATLISVGTYLERKKIDRRRTYRVFANVKEKISSRLARCEARVLSQAGKTVLVISILAGIPLFTVQCIKMRNNF